jgi:hypothetical protein
VRTSGQTRGPQFSPTLTTPFVSKYKVPNSVPFELGRVMSMESLIGSPAAKDVTSARH